MRVDQKRFSQRELEHLREADTTLRDTAAKIADGDVEPGPLRFSHDAYAKLVDVPALIQAVETANELLRNGGKRLAAGGDRSLKRAALFTLRVVWSFTLAVCSIALSKVGLSRAAAALDVRSRAFSTK